MNRSALLAFIALFSAFAHASLSGEFQFKFEQALQALAAMDVRTLGRARGVDGDNLLPLGPDLSQRLHYVEVDSIGKPEGATRRSAFAVCETQTVYINRAEFTPGRIPLPIVLHESLGALCVEDEGYEISTILALLIENQREGFAPKGVDDSFASSAIRVLGQAHELKRFYFERPAAQVKIEMANGSAYIGGATYIGNAGDEAASRIRFQLLKRLIGTMSVHDRAEYELRLRQIFFDIEVERVRSSSSKVRYVSGPGSSVGLERFYFYVPQEMEVELAVADMYGFLMNRLGLSATVRAEGYVPHARN